ncbi:MAG: archease [Thermoleophilia bacterium]
MALARPHERGRAGGRRRRGGRGLRGGRGRARRAARRRAGEPAEREVRVAANDRGALLVAWLEELLFLAETEGLVPEAARLRLAPGSLAGVVRGRLADARPLVKAVTYHRLEVAQDDAGWHARVVLDV